MILNYVYELFRRFYNIKGRTGRAGEKGTAYTLVTSKDKEFLPHLVKNLENTNQAVPENLLNLALEVQWFKNQRQRGTAFGSKPKTIARPGLGLASSSRPDLTRVWTLKKKVFCLVSNFLFIYS